MIKKQSIYNGSRCNNIQELYRLIKRVNRGHLVIFPNFMLTIKNRYNEVLRDSFRALNNTNLIGT